MRDTDESGRETVTPARDRTEGHLAAAVAALDRTFGEGYARENPALVASLVQAAAIEHGLDTARALHAETLETVQRVTRETNETILRLKPRLF